MLRSAGIRSKILAVLVLPLMLLGIAAGLLATQQVQHARQAHEVEKIAAVSGAFAQLVRGIAAERAATAAAMQGSEAAAETLPGVRAQVDEGLARARESVGGVDFSRLSTQAEQALGNVERAHVELGLLRETVDRDGAPVDTVMASFGDILREDLAMPGRVAAGVDDLRTADLLVGYGHLLTTRDLALREQEVGLRILAGAPTAADARTFATLGDDQTEEVARWQFAVGSEAADEAAQLVGRQTRTVWSIARARVALTSPATVDQTGLTPELWTEITDARVEGLDEALAGIAAEVDSQAEAASSRATTLAAMAAGGAVLGVGITLLLSLVLSRRIVRPLRELTSAATSVRELLPQMVEQVRVPGAMPDVELPRIAVSGDDEVGRLAAAFNDVNDTVLRVAEEQAALRGSIAETFVNVARRNQVLLSRQLAFIDRLEQREEDPDTLDSLFRLDHLATRMRRNAESLLVLANIEAGRRLRQPLALSDVIRTAAGEIEQYERISLQLQVDPPTMGHLSLQLAHLLAELLENGTNFSEPHAPVVVTTASTGSTIRVTVADEGLGLTDEELEAARDKVSTSAADDVVTSQRLGYYVVGRLARRLGVTVSIARGATKGLVVTVDLPPSLFVPGSVEVLDPADQARSVLLGGTSPQAAVLEAPPAEVDPRSSGPVPSAHAVPRAAGVPATGSGAPTAPVVGPAPSLPPAAVPSSPLLMPALAPETGTSAEVRVAPNGASLPRRDRTASAAVTGPAVLPAAGSAGRGAPADAETLTGAGSTSQPPVVSALPADEVTRPALAGPAHGRRAGLFGAFRARREVPVGDPADSLRPGPVPATMAEKPQTRGVPPQAARTSRARPEAPTGATAVAPVPQVSPTVEPQARASVPERAPVPAPGPVGAPQTAPSAAGARPGAGASRPLPAPMVSPVDILPAHGRRRARRGGLGGGRPPTPPEGLASDPVLPDHREVWEGTLTVGGPVPGASGGPAPAAPAGAPALPAGAVPSGLEPRGGGTGVPPQGGVPGPRPAGHRTGTPAATGTAAPAAGTAGRHPVGPSVGELRGLADGEEVRQRSMLASEALSELSRLSSYSPASVAGRSTPVPLVRRQPAVSEVAERSVPAARVPEPRQRDAAQVRTMLSGFQSGVSRGRAGDEGVVGGTDRSTAQTDGVTPSGPAAPPALGGSPDDRASGSGATSTTTSTSNDTSTTD